MCESDPLARSVLKKRFPEITIRTDVRKIAKLPACELLTAGWPCQDLSQAGMTAGIDGERSGLVSEVFRLIKGASSKPEFVLLENVAFAAHLHGGAALKFVTSNLERLGYRWAYRILDSRQFGVPQRRRRIFILGSLSSDPQNLLFKGSDHLPESSSPSPSRFGFYWTEGNRGLGWSPESIPPLKGGSSFSIPSPPAIWDKTQRDFFTPGIADAERMQGFPAGWTKVEELRDEKKRMRWKLVGNAVSVPVVEWIGRNLTTKCSAETFNSSRKPARSANAAFGKKGEDATYFTFSSEGPAANKIGSLRDFKFSEHQPLSVRAASGFLSRVENSTLKTHPRFITDLRQFIR